MMQIRGIYQVALRGRELWRAAEFYREVFSPPVELRDEGRWLLLRPGGQPIGGTEDRAALPKDR